VEGGIPSYIFLIQKTSSLSDHLPAARRAAAHIHGGGIDAAGSRISPPTTLHVLQPPKVAFGSAVAKIRIYINSVLHLHGN
jgi:hypothetical protein